MKLLWFFKPFSAYEVYYLTVLAAEAPGLFELKKNDVKCGYINKLLLYTNIFYPGIYGRKVKSVASRVIF